jgi:carboxypeptidase Q
LLKNIIKDNASHDFYFTYHHSAGDSMTMMNADDLDSNVIGLASLFFLLADAEESLPKV